jgi:DNA-binding transcriptional MerR regulator
MDQKKYSIKTVAKLIGVPADTLRNWERRYHFLNPKRTGGGARCYSDNDVELLKRIVALTLSGERIGDIAERVRNGERLPSVRKASETASDDIQTLIEQLYQAILLVDYLNASMRTIAPEKSVLLK